MQVILVHVVFCLISIDKYTQAQASVMLLYGILKYSVLNGLDCNTICILKIYNGLVLHLGREKI